MTEHRDSGDALQDDDDLGEHVAPQRRPSPTSRAPTGASGFSSASAPS